MAVAVEVGSAAGFAVESDEAGIVDSAVGAAVGIVAGLAAGADAGSAVEIDVACDDVRAAAQADGTDAEGT